MTSPDEISNFAVTSFRLLLCARSNGHRTLPQDQTYLTLTTPLAA